MTVAELIEELQKMPQGAHVGFSNWSLGLNPVAGVGLAEPHDRLYCSDEDAETVRIFGPGEKE